MSLGVRLWRIQCPGDDEFERDGEQRSRIEEMTTRRHPGGS